MFGGRRNWSFGLTSVGVSLCYGFHFFSFCSSSLCQRRAAIFVSSSGFIRAILRSE